MKTAAGLLDKYYPLTCRKCGVDLLQVDAYSGNIVFVERLLDRGTQCREVYVCCKKCDREIEQRLRHSSAEWLSSWKDISDVTMPVGYLMWVMSVLNSVRDGLTVFEDDAWDQLKHIMIEIGQVVFRNMTPDERERVRTLQLLPSFLGGMGE